MKPIVVRTISISGTTLCALYFLFIVLLSLGVSSQSWDTSGTSEYDLYEGQKDANLAVVAIYSVLAMMYLIPWFRYFRRIRRECDNPDYCPFSLDIGAIAKSILTIVYVLLTFGMLYNLVRLPWAQATVEINADGFAYRDFFVLSLKWLTVIFIGTPIYGILSLAGVRER